MFGVSLSGRACSVSGRSRCRYRQAHSRQPRSNRRLTRRTQSSRTLKEGKNADYIPALAKVDPNLFGIALVTADGKVYTAGDVKTEVSIQSISKVFTMAQVIQEQGPDAIEQRIGVDATGARFNSIIAVEAVRTVVGTGAPEMNPLVNPGAISATSMVTGATSDAVWQKIIGFHNDAAGRQLSVLQDVYKSESDTNQRNQAIGALMLAYGYIKGNWQQAVDLYTRQCSIGVNARDLATMAATLAAAGKNPVTGKQVIDAAKVPNVLAVMSTAGLYDDSGKWLYHTGLPAKSGVGGGIIAVSPGKFGIAVVAPPLDEAGNSVKAQRAIDAISAALGGNPYGVPAKAAQRRAEVDVRDLRVCDARRGGGLQADRPRLVRHAARHQAAVVRGSVRRGRQLFRRRAPEPPGLQLVDADRGRRIEDHLRVRAVRHRRGLRADHVPPAPCVGRARRVRGRSVLEPVQRSRRLPELAGVLGPHGYSVVPQRAAPLHADPAATPAT